MSFYKPGSTVLTVRTITDATGAVSDADALPTAVVFRNGVKDVSVGVTVIAQPDDGDYALLFDIPEGYDLDDVVSVKMLFTMDTIPSGSVLWEEKLADFPVMPSAEDIATAVKSLMEATPGSLASIMTATEPLRLAGWTSAQWKRLRAAVMGKKAFNADKTQAQLKDVDGTIVDTETRQG